MKHQRSIISIGLAIIMLVPLCAVVSTTSVSAAPNRSANVTTSNPASTSVITSQSSSVNVQTSAGLASAPAGVVGAPAVCSQSTNRLDLFVRGTDNALWWRHEAGGVWSAWTSLGGVLTSSPAATGFIIGSNYVVYVGVRGTNGALYWKQTMDGGGAWTSWLSFGGQLLEGTGPAVYSQGNTVGFFVTGTNHQLYRLYSSPVWKSFGGYLTSSPSATSPRFNIIYVAARGGNGALYLRYTTDGGTNWASWYSWGGQLLEGTGPALVSPNPSYSTGFVTGTNHRLYSFAGGTSWQSLGGYLTSGPAAASQTTDAIDVFALGSTGGIYSRWTTNDGTSWSPWYRVTL